MSDESSNNPIFESKNQPSKDWGKLGLSAGFVALGAAVIGLLAILLSGGGIGVLVFGFFVTVPMIIITFGASLAGIVMSIVGSRKAAGSKKMAKSGIILNVVLLFSAVIVGFPFLSIMVPLPALENDYLYGMDFSPDGKILATGWTNEIRLLDTETGKRIQTLKGHTAEVDFISYSPDGAILASASRDNTIRFWDTATNKEIHSLNLDYGWFKAMSFQSATNQLMVVTQEKGIVMIDTATYEISDMISLGEIALKNMVLFSPDGSLIGINKDFESPDLYIRNTTNSNQLVTLTDNKTDQFAFSPDNTMVAVSRRGGDELQIWELSNLKQVYSDYLTYGSSDTIALSFSPNNEKLAYTQGEYFNLLNIKTNQVTPFEASNDNKRFDVSEIVFSPNGTLVAVNITDYVMLWNVTTARLLWQYP
jgi:WD40 repeat protein